MKKYRNIALGLVVVGFTIALSFCTYYNINVSKVSNNNETKEIVIKEGTINSIAINLKENHLIKNITIFKVYTRLTGKTNLKAGTYELSENMTLKEIVNHLEKGKTTKGSGVTFKEGVNIRNIAKLISENTNNSYEDVMNKVNNEEYIDSLITKYWFLTDRVKDKNIYYSLEGYLYPDTYIFSKNDKVETIIERMLDETDKKLSKYKDELTNNKLSLHEIITVASIIELEVANSNDRKDVSGVIYNRINSSYFPTMGMDTTAYYGAKIDNWKTKKLTASELNDCSNKYNTRCATNTGLPIGPICNPSVESVEAALNPNKHNYYYFVNDCKGKLYLSKTDTEHNNTINKLVKEGNWCA